MQSLSYALAEWEPLRQFVLYQLSPSTSRPGKIDKFPVDKTGKKIDSQDATNWMTFGDASLAAHRLSAGYGVGFVFTKNDPYFFIDIDNCLTPDGTWSPLAVELCGAFPGAAVEVSSSGKGLHIFGRGTAPSHVCKNTTLNIELYTSGRFVALTGTNLIGNVATDHTEPLQRIVDKYFTAAPVQPVCGTWTYEPVKQWRGPTDDDDLIDRMLRSKSIKAAFGAGASFSDLWDANSAVLAIAYPDSEGMREYDASSADAALAQHLAFWTGSNCERMQSLMLRSKLVREKWQREDYIQRTILHACSLKNEWLQDKEPQAVSTQLQTLPIPVTGKTLLGPAEQASLFAGCFYVQDEHKIMVPGGALLKDKQFKATYGGYSFIMDSNNERVVRNAWEVFTESQAIRFPRVISTCFKPNLPAGEIIKKDERTLVNIWSPISPPRVEGYPDKFITHLYKLIPDPRDALIFLSYMAACVQYQGTKFKWAPVIQGVEGNGKSLFSLCVAQAIGMRYSHFPKASQVSEKYNDWLYKNIFIGIEDMAIFDYGNDIVEIMKPMITQDELEIRSMGTDKIMRDICCNFILNTNHKDGVRKSANDRRYAPFFTAQQEKADLVKDGLDGDYFPELFNWLENQGGYGKVANFLQNFDIPAEFNPSFKKPAPTTSSTQEAIEYGMGFIEQEILEYVAQDIPCFRAGWISSTGLDRLLEKLKATRIIPPNRRRDLLRSLGYDYHPALPNGRVNTIVLPDGNKPRLYVQLDNAAARLATPSEVVQEYIKAQTSIL